MLQPPKKSPSANQNAGGQVDPKEQMSNQDDSESTEVVKLVMRENGVYDLVFTQRHIVTAEELDAARRHLYQVVSEAHHEARLTTITHPSFGMLTHLLGIATGVLWLDKLERLEKLRPVLESLHAQFQTEMYPEERREKLDGPTRPDYIRRMDAAAQLWMDEGGLDPSDGVRWVACEALSLFDGETKAALQDLSLLYQSFETEHGETVSLDAPDIVRATADAWARKRQAASHDYVSIVLRAAGVSGAQVNEMFAYKRVAKKRAARKR